MSRRSRLEVLIVAALLMAGCEASAPPDTGGSGGSGSGRLGCSTAPAEAQAPTLGGAPVYEDLFHSYLRAWNDAMTRDGVCPENFPDSFTNARRTVSARMVELALLNYESNRIGHDIAWDDRGVLSLYDLQPRPSSLELGIERARVEGRIWWNGAAVVSIGGDVSTDEAYSDALLASVPAGETEHVSIRAFAIGDHDFPKPGLRENLAREILAKLERDPRAFAYFAMVFGNSGRVRWEIHLGGERPEGDFFLADAIEAHRGETIFAVDRPGETWFVAVDERTTDDLDAWHRRLIDQRWREETHQAALRAFFVDELAWVTVEAEDGTELPSPGVVLLPLWSPPVPGSGTWAGSGRPGVLFDDYYPPGQRQSGRR